MFRFLIYISLTLFAFTSKAQELVHLHEGRKLSVPLMGYNAHMAHAPSWDDKNFTDALKKLHPQILRYPGGSNSFYWDWKKGWTKSYEEFFPYLQSTHFKHKGKEISSPNELEQIALKNRKEHFFNDLVNYNSKETNTNTILNFKDGLNSCRSQGVFTLNLISSSLQNEIKMLRYADSLGINISFIELGNEINSFKHLLLEQFYPNAQTYADTCVNWAQSIWQHFPNTHIGIVGGNNNNRCKGWNETLAAEFQNAFPERKEQTHLILHHYSIFQKPFYNYKSYNEYQQLMGHSKLDLNQKIKWTHWDIVSNYSTWITEFNIIEKKPWELNNKWIHGLYVSNQINQFLKQLNATLFNFHSIGADVFPVFAALDLMNKDERYLQPTATGIVTSLWNRLTANAEHFQNIELDNELWEIYYPSKLSCDCPNNPRLPTTIEFNPIHAYKSSKGKKQKLLLTNTSEKPIQIELSEIGMSNAYMEQYSGSLTHDVRGELNQGDDWKVTKKAVHNKIEIPPYSITLIEE
ncbi:MAG: hypothetical protein H8D62_01555 [Bacteroidetes bacterium]|nr:hypothetical protein [Bacteroidota bacterium]